MSIFNLCLTLNRASAGIYACNVLYCTVLHCTVQYCTVIDFSPNTMSKVMWKSQGSRTSVSILNKFYKIIILFVSLVIYWQFQILTSQSIFSKCPKINSLLNFLIFFWIVGISEISQDYVSRLWPFLGCGGALYRLRAHLPAPPPPCLVIMSTHPDKG